MASTYVNDLRLNEMATGDGSGTWGTTTNTNLELIAEAFSYGTEVITTNADTHTTTIADGATDPGRSLYLKYTGTLDSACTITIGPNTVSKVWIIENGTSGSQDIILSQGSGANITIPAGDTKVVYSDGAGAGAAFFDAFASLSVVDLKVQDDLTVTGDIDVDGTTNLDVVDIDGALTQDGGAVFNETGADVDFRVESDTVDHALFVQGSDGNVGIGTDSPDSVLHVSDTSQPKITIEDSTNNSFGRITGGGSTGSLTFEADFDNTKAGTVMAFNVDNTERLRIDSDGNVGIGTSSPTFDAGGGLHISNATAANIRLQDTTTNVFTNIWQADNGTTSNFLIDVDPDNVGSGGTNFFINTVGTTRLTLNPAGNVGLGTTSPSSLLHLSSSAPTLQFSETDVGVENYIQASGGGFNFFADDTDAAAGTKMGFFIDGSEHLRLNASGNLLVGTTATVGTSPAKLEILGDAGGGRCINTKTAITTSANAISFNNGNGQVGSITTNGSATAYNTSSDARLKDVTGEARGLEVINELNPVAYNWKADGKADEGLIAQEVLDIVPNAVSGSEEEMYQMDYSKLVVHLVAGMKEQQVLIESLTARITTLEG
jgi:hypothetical protein